MVFAKYKNIILLVGIIMMTTSCASVPVPQNQTHKIGVGSKDFYSLATKAINDMRLFFSKQLVFSDKNCAARIMLDKQKFENESAERIDFNLLIAAFVSHLNNPKNAEKLGLLGRYIAFIDDERRAIAGLDCKNKQKVGADYMLAGRIISDDKITKTDIRERQTLISFWLLDLETGAKAWSSPPYLFKRAGQNDIIYR